MGKTSVKIIQVISKLPGLNMLFAFIELVIRVLCDTVRPAEVIYMFGQTEYSQKSVFLRAVELYKAGFGNYIAMPGFESVAGFPGFSKWKTELLAMNVPEVAIIGIPWEKRKEFSTRTEAIDLIAFAKKNGWRSITVIGAPFHLPRCALSAIGQVMNQMAYLKLFSQPGTALPWTEQVVHSQGISKGRRAELISREMIAILIYILKGDLPRPKVALRYLNQRDV